MMEAIKTETRAKIQQTSLESNYITPFFKPATQLNPNNIWLRRMTRIIRHLRDDLTRLHPQELMPTTWMIKCLLASLAKPEFNALSTNQFAVSDDQWDKNVLLLLQKLLDFSASPEHIRSAFFELDGYTPLFPNQELFGPQHVNRFAELALNYMNTNIANA